MQEVLKTPSALAWIAESDWNFAKSRCMPLQSRLQRTNARKAFTIWMNYCTVHVSRRRSVWMQLTQLKHVHTGKEVHHFIEAFCILLQVVPRISAFVHWERPKLCQTVDPARPKSNSLMYTCTWCCKLPSCFNIFVPWSKHGMPFILGVQR